MQIRESAFLTAACEKLVNEGVRGTASSHCWPVGSDRLQPPSTAWPDR